MHTNARGNTGRRKRGRPDAENIPMAESTHTVRGIRQLRKLLDARTSRGVRARISGPKKSQNPTAPGTIPEKNTNGNSCIKFRECGIPALARSASSANKLIAPVLAAATETETPDRLSKGNSANTATYLSPVRPFQITVFYPRIDIPAPPPPRSPGPAQIQCICPPLCRHSTVPRQKPFAKARSPFLGTIRSLLR